MANRLARESSPYLRQHAHNPVDWYPWGDEAFEKARREDRPVFLSIGYSSCHWCHVMERESFENEEIARILNEHLVSIKVDREERPDVDDVYMTAVQLMSGRGGWPLSAFLLPDKRPFFAGTYFPPDDRHGRPGFLTVLKRLERVAREARRPRERRRRARRRSRRGVRPRGPWRARAPFARPPRPPRRRPDATLRPGPRRLRRRAEVSPHLALAWLLRRGAGGDAAALAMAEATLDAMALGGIRDHLGGGFHRYSTDAEWLLPHFEKMLTDNAQLLGLYARAYALTGDETYARVARSTGDYLLREMRGAEGGFYAGRTRTRRGGREILRLGPGRNPRGSRRAEGSFFCEWYGVREGGNFSEEASGRRTGASILHLSKKISSDAESRLKPLRERLLAARARASLLPSTTSASRGGTRSPCRASRSPAGS